MGVSDNQHIFWRFFLLTVTSWLVLPVYNQRFYGVGTPSSYMFLSPSRYGAKNPSPPSGKIIQKSAHPVKNSVNQAATQKTEKPGFCPSVVLMTSKKCPDACVDDNDCAGMTKCCLNGCGKRCTAPEVPAFIPNEPITNKQEVVPAAVASQINGSNVNSNNSQSTEAPPSGIENQPNQPRNGYQNNKPVREPNNVNGSYVNSRPIPFSFHQGSTPPASNQQYDPRGGSNIAPHQSYYATGGSNNFPSNPVNREIPNSNFRGGSRGQPPPQIQNSARGFNNYPPNGNTNGLPYNRNSNGGSNNQQGFQHYIPSTTPPNVIGGQNHNMNLNNNPNAGPQGYQYNRPPGGSHNPMGRHNPVGGINNQENYSPIPQFNSYNNPQQGQLPYSGSIQYSNPSGGSNIQPVPPNYQHSNPVSRSNIQPGPSNYQHSYPVSGSNIQPGPPNSPNSNPLSRSNIQPIPPNNQQSNPWSGSNIQPDPPINQNSNPLSGSNIQSGPPNSQYSNPPNNQHSIPVGGSHNAPYNSPGGYPSYNSPSHPVEPYNQGNEPNYSNNPSNGSSSAAYYQPLHQAPEPFQNSPQSGGSNFPPINGVNQYNQQNGGSYSQRQLPRTNNHNTHEMGGFNHQINNREIQPNIRYDNPIQSQNAYEVQSPSQQQLSGGSNSRHSNAAGGLHHQNNPRSGSNSNGGGSRNLYSVPLYQTTPLYEARDGMCPEMRGRGGCQDECYTDSECPDRRKCCSNGCGRVCMIPVLEGSPSKFTVPEAIQKPIKQNIQGHSDPVGQVEPHSLNLIEIRPYSVGQSHSAVQILPYDYSGGHYDPGQENTIYNELVNEPPPHSEHYSYTTEPPYAMSESRRPGAENIANGIHSAKDNLLPGSAVKLKPSLFGSYKIIPFNMDKVRKRNTGVNNQSVDMSRRKQRSGAEVRNSRPSNVQKPETPQEPSRVQPSASGSGGAGSEPLNMVPRVQRGPGTFKTGNYNIEPQIPREQIIPQRKSKQYPRVKIPQRTLNKLPNRSVPEINKQPNSKTDVATNVEPLKPSVDGSKSGSGALNRKTNPNTFKIRESQNHNGAMKITPLETEGYASQSVQASKIKRVEEKPRMMQNVPRDPPVEVSRAGPRVKYTTTRETMNTGPPEATYAGPQRPGPRLTPRANRNSDLRLTATSAPVRDPGIHQKGEINPIVYNNKNTGQEVDLTKKSKQQGPNKNVNPVNSIKDKNKGYGKSVYDPMPGRSAPQELNPSNQFETGMIRSLPKSGSSFSLTGGGKDPGSNMYSGSAPLQYNAANLGISDYGHLKVSAFESEPIRRQRLGQSSSSSTLSISKIYHDIGNSRAIMEPPNPFEYSSEFRLRATERPISTYRPPVHSLGQVYIDIAGFSDNSLKTPQNPMKLSSAVRGHIPEIKTTTPLTDHTTARETPIYYVDKNTTDKVISNSLLKNPKPEKKDKPVNPEKYIPPGMVLARSANESISASEPKPSPSAPRLGISSTLIGSAPVAPPSKPEKNKIYNRDGFNLYTGYKPQYIVPVKEIRNPSMKGTPVFSAKSQSKG